MNARAQRNTGEVHAIARIRGRLGSRHDGVSHLQPFGSQNVALLTIGIKQESDEGGAIGIVFNGLHRRWNVQLVTAKVHHTVHFLMATAHIAHGHFAIPVSAPGFGKRGQQGLLRLVRGQLRKGISNLKAKSRG